MIDETLLAKARETRHILLTGSRGVGKSTIVKKLLSEYRGPVSGFFTAKESPDCSGLCHSFIHSAAAGVRTYSRENEIGSCDNRVCISFHSEVFDGLGVSYLERGSENLLVMDELGFMESRAAGFTGAVLSELCAPRPVLAVVKSKDVPFLNALRNHENAACFSVTEENREELHHALRAVLLEF